MADESYWQWYQNAFPQAVPQQNLGPAAGPAPLTPAQWASFYQSVGITPRQGNAPSTRVVQSVPVPGSGPSHLTSYSTLSKGSSVPEDYRYASAQLGAPRINASAPDRLMASAPGLDVAGSAGMSPLLVAQIGTDLAGNKPSPYPRPRPNTGLGPLTMVAQAQPSKVAPVPFPPYRAVASEIDAGVPLPLPRPYNKGQPMPPMPIARPGIGGPVGPAPAMGPLGIKLPSLPMAAIQQAITAPKANIGSGGYNAMTGTFNQNLDTIHNGFSGAGSSGGAHGGSSDNHATKYDAQGRPLRR